MQYCTKCGKQNVPEAKFCTGCGSNMQLASSQSSVFAPQAADKKINNTVLIAIASLLLLGGAAWFLFFKNKAGSKQTENKEAAQASILKGKYAYTSERLLTGEELSNMAQEDLRIMRNEIFARHGLIFQSADMRNYFMSQSWYTPLHSNVLDRMSKIEKDNVALIKRYEKYNNDYYGDYGR